MSSYDILTWSKGYRLRWSDFQADFNYSSIKDAHSTIKYAYTWTLNSKEIENHIEFFIENIQLTVKFFPMLSWVRKPNANPTLLNHEQGHFDLAELLRSSISEKIQNMLNGKTFPSKGQNSEQQKQFAREYSNLLIAKEFEIWDKYLLQKREEYDELTDFGQISEKQREFDEKFQDLL